MCCQAAGRHPEQVSSAFVKQLWEDKLAMLCPSIPVHQRKPYMKDFYEILYVRLLLELVSTPFWVKIREEHT